MMNISKQRDVAEMIVDSFESLLNVDSIDSSFDDFKENLFNEYRDQVIKKFDQETVQEFFDADEDEDVRDPRDTIMQMITYRFLLYIHHDFVHPSVMKPSLDRNVAQLFLNTNEDLDLERNQLRDVSEEYRTYKQCDRLEQLENHFDRLEQLEEKQ